MKNNDIEKAEKEFEIRENEIRERVEYNIKTENHLDDLRRKCITGHIRHVLLGLARCIKHEENGYSWSYSDDYVAIPIEDLSFILNNYLEYILEDEYYPITNDVFKQHIKNKIDNKLKELTK